MSLDFACFYGFFRKARNQRRYLYHGHDEFSFQRILQNNGRRAVKRDVKTWVGLRSQFRKPGTYFCDRLGFPHRVSLNADARASTPTGLRLHLLRRRQASILAEVPATLTRLGVARCIPRVGPTGQGQEMLFAVPL